MTIVRIFCYGDCDYAIRRADGVEFRGFESYVVAERFAKVYGWSIAH